MRNAFGIAVVLAVWLCVATSAQDKKPDSPPPGRGGLSVVNDDPFEFSTRALRVMVHGRTIAEPSRQDLLMERYKSTPPVYIRQP